MTTGFAENLKVSEMTKTTAGSGKRGNIANLKPFQKGVSGNPSGRNQFSDGKSYVRAKAQELAFKALSVLEAQLDSTDERIAQSAAKEILDRAFGKPVQCLASTDSECESRPLPPPMVVVAVGCNKT
jgi:hypothetical protein